MTKGAPHRDAQAGASVVAGWPMVTYLLAAAGTACVLSVTFSAAAPSVMRESLWGESVLGLVLLGLLGSGALWFSGHVKLPLRDLVTAATEGIKGHLEARVPARRCPRELAQLSAEFNAMMARLQQTEAELQAAKAELEQRVCARTAELATANRDLEAFAYSISHDLRAPVRLVQGFAELLGREALQLSPRGRESLQAIRGEARHMNEMIDALLEMSRVTRGPLAQTPVDLSAMAAQIAHSLQRTDPERQVEFVLQPGLQVCGDERLLREMLQNLLGNAWKFTRYQSQPVIEFGATQQEGRRVLFVRDNGAGFELAGATRLFTPFQRFHPATEFEGAGVGLATVRRIVERHGGQIWVQSEPGKGATFYFTLPERDACPGTHSLEPRQYES